MFQKEASTQYVTNPVILLSFYGLFHIPLEADHF